MLTFVMICLESYAKNIYHSRYKIIGNTMKVLFICKSNAERSQVAEVLFNHFSKKHTALSAGTNVKKENGIGESPGFVMSEILLGMGHSKILKKKRKQVTKKMIDAVDMVIVILMSNDVKKLVPSYIKDSKKTVYWQIGFRKFPSKLYASFPPYTYSYHLNMVKDINHKVTALAKNLDS